MAESTIAFLFLVFIIVVIILSQLGRSTPKKMINEGWESKGERRCRQVLEKRYGVPFAKDRPNWLRNPETGHLLELDCYNKELQLAVEYGGIQHYEHPNFLKESKDKFFARLRRDAHKVRICKQEGVKLIVVPYTVPLEEIEDFIYEELK